MMTISFHKWAGRPVLVEERRQEVLELVSERGFMALADLAKALNTSESTIRRDLDYWDHHGQLRRTHGGAICRDDGQNLPALEERQQREIEEKRLIARAAAARIRD